MEKEPNQEYRDELAEKLKEIRNSDPENSEIAKAKAEGYLEAKRETEEYKDAKKSHQEEVLENYSSPEIRAEMLWDKIEHISFSKEDLIEALGAIDKLYECGQIVPVTHYYDKLFNSSEYQKKYELGSINEYDFYSLNENLASLRDAVNKIGIAGRDFDHHKFQPYSLSHANRVVLERGGEFVEVTDPTDFEYDYAKQEYKTGEMEGRLERAISFLKKFKKSVEQVAEERKEHTLKKQAEEEEKQRQVKEKELNKFDASI